MTTNNKFDARALYDTYTVEIRLRGRLYGGTPKNKDLIEAWVKARTGHEDEQTSEQVKAAIEVLVDETAEKSWSGFQGDDKGLFVAANNLKAMLKQSASMLAITVKKRGSRQILAEGMEVKAIGGGERVYLGKASPDGFEERPIHVKTAQGPRTALKRIDYVEGISIAFEIWVLKTQPAETRHIGEKELVQILTFSQENGFGADRSQGAGKFDVLGFEKA